MSGAKASRPSLVRVGSVNMDISWGTILTVAGTTGVLTALLNHVLWGLREWRAASSKKKDHASYLALRLAVLLESYANACSDFISENAHAEQGPEDQLPNWDASLPTLPPYPEDDEGWRAIDRRLAGRVLNLPNRIHASQSSITWTIELNDDELGETLDEEAAARGLEAWKLAVKLRRMYNIEAVEIAWDFPRMLENTLAKAQREKQRNDELHARMWEPIESGAGPSKPSLDGSA